MKHELIITRTFDAPRDLVFQAWTDPKHLQKWWGPHGFTNPVCKTDIRPGGAIHIDMQGPDGTTFPMLGTFREVTPPARLSFVCGPVDPDGAFIFEVINTVEFAERAGKTDMTLKATVMNAKPGFEQYWKGAPLGWEQSLEKLEDSLGPLRTITDLRAVKAPRELVWQVFTQPEHLVDGWGPKGFTTAIESMDVRRGRIVMTHRGHKEGGLGVTSEATWTFNEIEPGLTLVEIRMVFPTAEQRDFVAKEFKAVEDAASTLERLEESVEKSGEGAAST